jgi:hypothetical protein
VSGFLVRVWLLVSICGVTQLALAQAPANVPTRPISIVFHGAPALSFSAKDFVDAAVLKKLQSGLPQTVTTRVYAYAERDRDPLAVSALSCRVVYDLWDGVYRIERQTEHSDRTVIVPNLEGVLAQCLDVQSMSVGEPGMFARQHESGVYFAVVIELNPLSPDTVQRIRRWLARPAGSELSGNAFFGSFVSIFVGRKLGSAEKTLTFRSESIVVPP